VRWHCERLKIMTQFASFFVHCDFRPDWALDQVWVSHARRDKDAKIVPFLKKFCDAATRQAQKPGDRLIRTEFGNYRLIYAIDATGRHRGLGFASRSTSLALNKDMGVLLAQLCGAVTAILSEAA
jgi:hypothetical protein